MTNEVLSTQEKALIDEIIENYSDYIDNLKIDELLHILYPKYWKTGYLSNAVLYIMQYLVDELGPNIVNDLVFSRGCGFPYSSVEFNNHVTITKPGFMAFEFVGAKFNKGFTFKGDHLPSNVFANAIVHGPVDLTEVATLDAQNLAFAIGATGTVRLSTKLKTLHPEALAGSGPGVNIEYTGTKNEFTDLIKHHYEYYKHSDLLKSIEYVKIICSDGIWTVKDYD